MSAKAICEASGKDILNRHLPPGTAAKCHFASVTEDSSWDAIIDNNPWLNNTVS